MSLAKLPNPAERDRGVRLRALCRECGGRVFQAFVDTRVAVEGANALYGREMEDEDEDQASLRDTVRVVPPLFVPPPLPPHYPLTAPATRRHHPLPPPTAHLHSSKPRPRSRAPTPRISSASSMPSSWLWRASCRR